MHRFIIALFLVALFIHGVFTVPYIYFTEGDFSGTDKAYMITSMVLNALGSICVLYQSYMLMTRGAFILLNYVAILILYLGGAIMYALASRS